MKQELLSVSGMHCASCALPSSRLPWRQRVLRAVCAVALLSLVAMWVLPRVMTLVPAAASGGSVVAILLLGFVASVSTCLASTGAFLLAYTSVTTASGVAVRVQVGRLLGFAFGGALLGWMGAVLPQGTIWYGALAIILGVGFIGVGLQLLDLAPSFASIGIRLPRVLSQTVERVTARQGKTTPFLVGAATFLLPCGFTQTAQALALASGSPLRGALFMFAFAVGTLPILYGVSAFGSLAAFRRPVFKLASGAALFLVGIGQIDGGLTVLGSPVTIAGTATRITSAAVTVPTAQAQEQVISMRVQYGTFSPNRFVLKKNVPVRWQIEGVDVTGCAETLISPRLKINQSLVKGANEILFTPRESGDIPFSCGMGMIRGRFSVVE